MDNGYAPANRSKGKQLHKKDTTSLQLEVYFRPKARTVNKCKVFIELHGRNYLLNPVKPLFIIGLILVKIYTQNHTSALKGI